MKIKNLAFFGIMAAILGVNGAARADSTTIIASQAYVDAKDALKQNILNVNNTTGNIRVSGNGNVITGVSSTTDANGQGIVTFTTDDIDVSGDISTAIGDLDGNISGDTGVVKTISQTDGVVTATRDTVDTADITDGAVATAKLAANAVTNAKLAANAVKTGNIENGTIKSEDVGEKETDNVVVSSNTGYLATVDGVQKGIMYQSDSQASWRTADAQGSHFDREATQEIQEKQKTAEKGMATQFTKPDMYVPTVAAVEKRVQQAESAAGGAINNLNLTADNQSGVIKTVTQTNGQVDVTSGTVDTAEITNSAVTADKLASDSVTTAKIANANVTADKLASDSVTTAKIANANVTADKLASDSVTTGKIANGAVTTDKIANSNVTMGKTNFVATQGNSSASWLAATTQEYADEHQNKNVLGKTYTEAEKQLNTNNAEADKYVPTMAAVNSLILKQSEATDINKSWAVEENGDLNTKYKTAGDSYVPTVAAVEKRVREAESAAGGAINNLNLTADNQSGVIKTVTQTNGQVDVTSGTVDTAEITNSAVTADKLASDSVTTAKIANANVTADKLASDSVTTAKIADANVTSGKLADNAVTTDKINAKAVTAGKIADDTITASQIASDAVDTAEIKNGAVTNAKISANSLAYKDTMDPKLSNVNASNDAGTAMTNCTVGSPCTLTMIWDRTNSKPIYEWTNMDTENTDAVL